MKMSKESRRISQIAAPTRDLVTAHQRTAIEQAVQRDIGKISLCLVMSGRRKL